MVMRLRSAACYLAGQSVQGLLLISRQEGYLPPFLQKLNKNGVQQNILRRAGLRHHRYRAAYALIPDVSRSAVLGLL